MPIKVLMPALSPTMEEGKLSKWLVKEGDKVSSGDIIAEVETDKATIEYESTEEGVVGKLLVEEGKEGIKVNDLIAVFLEEGETEDSLKEVIASGKKEEPVESKPEETKETDPIEKEEQAKDQTSVKDEVAKAESVVSTSNEVKKVDSNRVFASPLARRIAKEKNIDISLVKGTGPNNRVVKQDVLSFNSSDNSNMATTNNDVANTDMFEDVPNSGMRKTIAKRLLESKVTVPHYYVSVDCEMDALLASRQLINEKGADVFKISVNDFIIKAVALALRDVPQMNASWSDEKTRYFKTSDIAVAVAIENGLITPIVKHAETKGLQTISQEMKSLVAKAKEGKLSPSEYQGGTFSISNLGMFGVSNFCAIVNPPHAGILAIGATIEKPIVKNSQIVVGKVMTVTLSADHRVADGAVAANFLQAFKGYIENPVTMII